MTLQSNDLMLRENLLRGHRILVTGGGTGLGRAMGEAALMLGAQVYICGRRGAVVESTAAELVAAHGGVVRPLVCDIRDEASVNAMLDGIWSDGGPLTGLVNNAAGNFVARTEDLSIRGFDAIANTAFRGTFLVTLACGKRWLAQGRAASVVSIVTTGVWNGSAFSVPAAMSKSGIHAMSQSLAVEWGGRGIRLNCIAPGLFLTEGMSARLNPGAGEHKAEGNPMGRTGEPAEIANLATFLLSPGANYLTGQTIAIDGAQYQATGGNMSALAAWSDEDWRQARESIRATNDKDRSQRSAPAVAS